MIGAAPWLAAAIVAIWAHRSAWTNEPRSVGRLLALLGVGLVGWRAIDLALRASHATVTPTAFLVLKAGLALVVWTAVVGLASFGRTRRDLWFRLPVLALAFLWGAGGSAGGAWIVTMFAVNAFRWTAAVPIRRVLLVAVGTIALLVVAWSGGQPPPPTAGHAWTPTLVIFQEWAFIVSTAYAFESVLALAGRLAGDPSLGIRRVSRRLALSHILVVGVPLSLTIMMWIATTILGVSLDRASVAARALTAETDALRQSLEGWISDPAHTPETLGSWTRLESERWPGVKAAWVADTTVVGHGGALTPAERMGVRLWADSLEHRPKATLLVLGDSIYAGAAVPAGAADHRRVAIALVPARSIAAVPASVSGAQVSLWAGKAAAGPGAAGTGSASARIGRNMRFSVSRDSVTRDNGVMIATRGQTFKTSRRSSDALAEMTRGHVTVPALALGPRGLRAAGVLLTAAIEPRILLGEMFQRHGDDLGAVPVVLLGTLLAMLALVAAFAIVMVRGMGRSITSAVSSLRQGAEHLEAGDLAHRIPISGSDDLWDVAGALNLAASGLERAQAFEKQRARLESELALARRIHARLLPTSPPDIAGVEIAGLSRSAREVGGDYYDHVVLDGGRLLLVIADVSGKGVPAALLMSAFRASLMSQDLDRLDITELAARLNGFMVRSVETGRFVTAFLGILDGHTGRLEYVNAGHNPPLVVRTGGRHERLEAGGLIFGILAGSRYERGETRLDPGDRLVLYTDGVTEGANATGEQWGEERLLDVLRSDGHESCRNLVERIAEEVRAFEGDVGPADDVTVLAARRMASNQGS